MLKKTYWIPAAAAALVISLYAQAPQGGGQGKGGGKGGPPAGQMIQQLKPNFYVVTGDGGNTGVRVTDAGLIIVDTKNLGDQFYDRLMEQIKSVTNQPVKYVVVTHVHQDHAGNIQKFVDAGAQVVTSEGLKANLATYTSAAGKPGTPNVTYAKDYTIKLGGAEADVHYYGRAHTSGDSFVYFPDLKIVMTGDSVVGVAPNVDFPQGGSAVEWPRTIDNVLKLDFDTCIPGHSAPGKLTLSKADVQEFKNKWDTLDARAVELVKKGTPKDQLLSQIKTDDIGWNVTGAQWNQPARLDAFYEELSKAK
jgi:cyclase